MRQLMIMLLNLASSSLVPSRVLLLLLLLLLIKVSMWCCLSAPQ
jgi:hypothetical protein